MISDKLNPHKNNIDMFCEKKSNSCYVLFYAFNDCVDIKIKIYDMPCASPEKLCKLLLNLRRFMVFFLLPFARCVSIKQSPVCMLFSYLLIYGMPKLNISSRLSIAWGALWLWKKKITVYTSSWRRALFW